MVNDLIYTNLAEVQARKEELRGEIRKSSAQIGSLWTSIFTPKKANTKGELVTNIISTGITAFDAFMLVRKLMNQYNSHFGHGKKKKR